MRRNARHRCCALPLRRARRSAPASASVAGSDQQSLSEEPVGRQDRLAAAIAAWRQRKAGVRLVNGDEPSWRPHALDAADDGLRTRIMEHLQAWQGGVG